MKRLLIATTLFSIGLLSACSTESDNEVEENVEIDSSVVEEEVTDGKQYLEDKTAYLRDINVTILESEVIPMDTYEFQEQPQLVITYEVKNKTDEEIDPIVGYLAVFDAYQEDENSERQLEVGPTPYMEKYDWAIETQSDIIKKDGTLKNIITYDLRDTETPVVLKAHAGVAGDYLGELIIHVE